MKEIIRKLDPLLIKVFNYLHENPEISWQEHRTTDYIEELLNQYDCRVSRIEASTGLCVEVGLGKPVIAMRADIDSLWQEVNGTFQANHSCGHDAHMTIVIGCLLTLIESKLPEKGTFRFIFQPAEEKGNGALHLLESGIIDDIDYLYGMHLRPMEELELGQFSPSIQHGAARFVEGKITGDDAHGARPHLNENAILIGTEFFQHINNISVNPMLPNSVKMTTFNAGGQSTNVIPGNATFSLDIRAQTNNLMEELTTKVKGIARMLSDYHQVDIDLEVKANIPAAVINEKAESILREAIIDSMGKENLVSRLVTTGGDDFHYYTIKKPKIKATMLAIGCDLVPGLHHPHMKFNHEVIPQAIEILTNTLLKTVKKVHDEAVSE